MPIAHLPFDLPFLPGLPSDSPSPLARFLPPLAEGIAAGYVELTTRPGEWVLDPFGQSPRAVVEAVSLGRRVLVAVSNPINRFLLEAAANPPDLADFQVALARLAEAPKDGRRLEVHLSEIYSTECRNCNRRIPAEFFVWQKEAQEPSGVYYLCAHCGDQGEHPVTQADVELARAYGGRSWHHALALERVAGPDDPDREHVLEALEVYPPRALYSLFTLLNRLEGLRLPPPGRRAADALIISTMDRANALWGHPDPRPRPRTLQVPANYREYNLWQALERAVGEWASFTRTFRMGPWPPDPTLGPADILVFEGPVRELAAASGPAENTDLSKSGSCALFVPPRPNQAFWSLSALWAGWLWGREAAASFKAVLRRRRYDWNWHTTALRSAAESLRTLLPEDALAVGLMPEAEPGFTAAVLAAFDAAGFELEGRTLRADPAEAQWVWRRSSAPIEVIAGPGELRSAVEQAAEEAARGVLRLRAEPTRWITLHAAAWSDLAQRRGLAGLFEWEDSHPLPAVNQALEEVILAHRGLTRLGGGEADWESGWWWLAEETAAAPPLADRVEAEVHRLLSLSESGIATAEIERATCAAFPGLLTPSSRLVTACLQSYGQELEAGSGVWVLRPEDRAARTHDVEATRQMLAQLGIRLGFEVTGAVPLEWRSGGQPIYTFAVIASAALGQYLLDPALDPSRSILVLPGGRASLAQYKLKHDPRLKAAVNRGWRLEKFRLIRRLVDETALTRANLDERFSLDPLWETEAQISMF